MPKLNVRLLRWGLLVLNCGALSLLGFTIYDLFTGSPEAVTVRLVEPEDFVLTPQAVRSTGNQYQKIISDLYRQPPPVQVAPVKPETDPALPLLNSGPIGDWEITGIIVSSAAGQRFATIQEKAQTAVILPGRSTRTVNNSRVRGTSSRTSSRGRTTRTPSRSSRAQVSNQRVRLLEQGKKVRIDDNIFTVVEIDDAPRRVLYEHNGLRYTLSAEDKIDPVLHVEGSGLVLRGFSPEEVDLLGGGDARVGIAAPSTAIPGDVRGSIKDQKGKAVPGTESKSPAATSARPANGTLRTPGVQRNTRSNVPGRGSRNAVPSADRAVPTRRPTPGVRGQRTPSTDAESRKQVEATLGVDLNDTQGTIRRLEELNRPQGQPKP